MTTHNPTRRDFLIASLGVIAATKLTYSQDSSTLTASKVIERIKSNLNVPLPRLSVDKIIAGNEDMPVTGIGVSIMATLDVIERAAAKGLNMVITHEPTFYSQRDDLNLYPDDSVVQYKRDYLEKNNVIVYRLYDQWLGRNPSGYVEGITNLMDLEKHADDLNSNLLNFEGKSLLELAKDIETKLNIKTLRVMGDPKMPVNLAFIGYGNTSLNQAVDILSRDDIDVLIIGEANEWDVNEYAIDIYSTGKNKAVIYLGHLNSDVPGMKFCAEWLKGIVKEVPIEYIDFPEPLWFADKPEWKY
ncbi:MAG: Nif3-like dinuclear metal center hexameric protein [Sedimentisphaerales bacterium]|nr:Nif3-like dinuclear metal center hexameric protein [Sedimentisphaerales bacterium]